MQYYAFTVVVMIGLFSVLLAYVLKRLELPIYRIAVATGAGSVVVSILFPVIFNLVSSSEINFTLEFALCIAVVISVILIFVISFTASLIIPDSAFEKLAAKFKIRTGAVPCMNTEEKTALHKPQYNEGNYIEEIFTNEIIKKQKETADFVEYEALNENNLGKSVDSEKNTDKMGIEMLDSDSELQTANLTIVDCIDEAFRLKESGDLEGAVLYFMYALDRKPETDLIFWIILDICILYKELNRVELAKEILMEYMENYSSLMPVAVRDEIESNLFGGLQYEENSRNTGIAYN